jgi:hypothetical protein
LVLEKKKVMNRVQGGCRDRKKEGKWCKNNEKESTATVELQEHEDEGECA